MKKGFIIVLTLILSIYTQNKSFAQIDNNEFKVVLNSTDLGVCGGANNSLSEVLITAKKSTLSNFQITFDLPDGIDYIGGTATISGGTAGYIVTEVDISNLNVPIFSISKGGNWAIGDQPIFTFQRTAGCGAVQYLEGGGLFKDVHTINYDDNGTAKSATDNDLTVSGYDLLAASLGIQNISSINANIGDHITREVTLVQGGNGCISTLSYYVVVGADLSNYVLRYGATPLVPAASIADTLFYNIDLTAAPFLVVGNGDGCFDNGEEIRFNEDFDITACQNTDTRHHAYWGCSIGEVCQEAPIQTGSINFSIAAPSISLTNVGNTKTDLCHAVTYTIKIENTNNAAGATAIDVNINFGLGKNASLITSTVNNPLWAFDYRDNRQVSKFSFDGGANYFLPAALPSTFLPFGGSGTTVNIPSNFFNTDPDGPGVGLEDLDGDGFYDDLAPGAAANLTFDYELVPRDGTCGAGQFPYIEWEHSYFDVNFKDQCKTDQNPKRIDLSYFSIKRDYTSAITNVISPTDIADTDGFTVKIRPGFYIGGAGAPSCNGESSTAGSDVVFTTKLLLPAGITWDGTAATLSGGAFAMSGDTLIYTRNRINNTEYYDFPLTLDCATYAGGGTASLQYFTTYECGSCWKEDINCGTIDIAVHCSNIPCDGANILDFTAQRTSAGWTDNTMSTKVTLDPNVHVLNKYLAGDTMLVKTKAVISNKTLDNLHFDMTYNATAAAGGAGIIQYVGGSITIDDISAPASVSGSIPLLLPSVTSVGNDHTLGIDLSSFSSLYNATNIGYQYGEGNESDTVTLSLKFVFSKTFAAYTYYELKNFRGEFYSLNGVLKESCGSYGDKAYYERVGVFGENRRIEASSCTEQLDREGFYHRSNQSDMHPGEYRPPTQWDSTVVVLPPGAKFSGTIKALGGFEQNWTVGNGIKYTLNGNILTYYPDRPIYHDDDQKSTRYKSFYVGLLGTCTLAPTTNYTVKVYYQNFAYVNPTPEIITQTIEFVYEAPTFSTTPIKQNVVGTNDDVFWEVEMCNTSATGVDYNWLQVDSNPNVLITKAFTVDGSNTESAINFVQIGGKTWIEVDSILNGVANCKLVRFYASYTSCSPQTLTVSHGWDCSSYPADYTAVDVSCYSNSLNLGLNPGQAQLQLNITTQPVGTQNYCTPFHVELDLNSAQIADLLNPKVKFGLPGGGAGLTINQVTIAYPKGNPGVVVTPSIVNDTATINLLDHPTIASFSGILGSVNAANPNLRNAHITLELQLECGYLANSPITFEAYGDSPCGDAAIGSGTKIASAPIQINGAVPSYNAFSTITLPAGGMQYCGSTGKINVATTIIAGTTGPADSARVTLPEGVRYVNGSFNGITNTPTTPVIITVGNRQILLLKYPAGVINNEQIEFEFDVTTGDSSCNPVAEVAIENYISYVGGTCAGMSCGGGRITTGESMEMMVIEKPNLVIPTATSNYLPTIASGYYGAGGYYEFSIDINNTGLEAAAGYELSFYCVGSATPFHTENTTAIVPMNGSITHETIFTEVTQCDPANGIIVKIEPNNNNCLCAATELLVIPTVLTDNDQDGIHDAIDLDDDNDGILDTLEDAGNNDVDNDLTINSFDTDSDNDGCPDVTEAGFTDNDGDGILGDTPVTVDADGLVTSGTDGYTNPDNTDASGTFDFLEYVEGITLTTHPIGHEIIALTNTYFFVEATGDQLTYQWQYSDDGNTWENIVNDVYYAGATSDTLHIANNNSYVEMSGYIRLVLNGASDLACNNEIISDEVMLLVEKDCDGDGIPNRLDPDRCDIIASEGFSPNGDTKNDTWFVEGIFDYPNHHLVIYNRWGNKVYEAAPYKNDWGGKSYFGNAFGGDQLPEGTYFYVIDLGVDGRKPLKGFITLKR